MQTKLHLCSAVKDDRARSTAGAKCAVYAQIPRIRRAAVYKNGAADRHPHKLPVAQPTAASVVISQTSVSYCT